MNVTLAVFARYGLDKTAALKLAEGPPGIFSSLWSGGGTGGGLKGWGQSIGTSASNAWKAGYPEGGAAKSLGGHLDALGRVGSTFIKSPGGAKVLGGVGLLGAGAMANHWLSQRRRIREMEMRQRILSGG